MKNLILIFLIAAVTKSFGMTEPIILHDKLGDVVDASENQRYNLFGDVPGFSAARLVLFGKSNYSWLVVRNVGDQAQFLRLNLKDQTLDVVRTNIHNRITRIDMGDSVGTALYPQKESKWDATTPNKIVSMRDGSQLYGVLSRANGDVLTVTTHGGLAVPVPLSLIDEVLTDHRFTASDTYSKTDPHATRLFFGPTARQLKNGRGYFADYYIFFTSAAYGISDVFSLAGGMSILPGLGFDEQVYYLMPKLTFELNDNIGVGGGLMYLNLFDEIDFSLGYGVATFGKTNAVTIGTGFPIGGEVKNPILLLGGELQLSNRTKLITENWFFIDNDVPSFLSGGVRFFGDRIAVDLAFITSPDFFTGTEGFPFIPWVDFAIIFGK